MKKILIIIVGLLFVVGCEDTDDLDTSYNIKLDKEPYKICNKEIYFSNNSYGNELDIEKIVEEIQENCQIYKLENVKDEIEIILSDSDLTKEEILSRLKNIYENLNR